MKVIEVNHLGKVFRIPHEKRSTIFETLTGLFRPTHFETFPALRDITFSVEEGEMIGIIGENGSGKSTLLKILARIMPPTSGKISVNRRLTPFLELGVGFNPDFTAIENIRTYGTIMGLSKREISERTGTILEFAGLEKFQDTKLKNFSSGMHVRLAFSTAIQTNPEILLLDEVLAVGDMEFQQKCMDVLNRFRNEGVTIIFISHDLGSIRRFCDRALLLRHGEQVALGDTNEVIEQYIYRKPNDESSQTEIKKAHRGEKKVEITGVKFFNKNGVESSRFNSFDSMTVRIFYTAHESVTEPIFGIALYSERGEHLFGTNTKYKGYTMGNISDNGYIDLLITRIPMFVGKYLFSVAIQAQIGGETYDWQDRQYSFEVMRTGMDDGLFDVPCRWQL